MLKDIICRKQSHINKLPDVFIDNNREYKADETTEGFNTFFTNIGSNLAKRITLQSGSFYDALPNSNCNSMLLSKTDAKEILSIVKKFSNKSSLDCNDMSMSIIKEIIPFVVNPFTYICNLSFYSGDFPNAMKIAKVLPVHKNGAKNEFNNYRPISLLPQFSKILEKLFDLRMEKFVNKHNILHDCQFGFRAGRSPNMALLSLIENITTSLDDHKHAVGVFMDIKKTFHTIDHNILLKKINHYGLRGIVSKWICSYLENRSQYVQFNGMKSGLQNVTCGVPQGSILGPKLLLLYINDICNVSNILDFILYADDTNVFYKHENIDMMCKIVSVELDKLSTWFALNKLALNISKTNFMIFSNHKSMEHSISIDGVNLQKVDSLKLLGVCIDHQITWKDHITYISNKLSKSIAIIYRASHVLDTNALYCLYNAIFKPHINYCIEVWGNTYKNNTNPVFILQKKVMRIVCHARSLDHTSKMFCQLDILKIYDLIDFNTCIFMYKVFHKLVPLTLQNKFSMSSSKKYQNNFYVMFARTRRKQFSITIKCVSLWNSLNNIVKLSSSLRIFKIN